MRCTDTLQQWDIVGGVAPVFENRELQHNSTWHQTLVDFGNGFMQQPDAETDDSDEQSQGFVVEDAVFL